MLNPVVSLYDLDPVDYSSYPFESEVIKKKKPGTLIAVEIAPADDSH